MTAGFDKFLQAVEKRIFTPLDIYSFMKNIEIELQEIDFSELQKMTIAGYYRDAGLLDNPQKERFFFHHFCHPLAKTIKTISINQKLRILDLGCGMGTQSLIFCLLGHEVIAIDLESGSLEILMKRKKYYENMLHMDLDLTVRKADAFKFDYSEYGPFDVVYSLFAFNMMQPGSELIKLLVPHLSANAFFIIQDGNRESLYNRLYRTRDVLSKSELHAKFVQNGFTFVSSEGLISLPPRCWTRGDHKFIIGFDKILSKSRLFANSYLHIAGGFQKRP